MLPTLRNLLTSLPSACDAEMTETLITAHGIRLQRIISFGQVSPEGWARPGMWCRRRGGGVARKEPVGRLESNAA